MRHNPQHERAGRGTGSINNDLLAGVSQRHIARPIRPDIAAVVVCYTNNGSHGCRQYAKRDYGERYCERERRDPSRRLPSLSESEFGVLIRNDFPPCIDSTGESRCTLKVGRQRFDLKHHDPAALLPSKREVND